MDKMCTFYLILLKLFLIKLISTRELQQVFIETQYEIETGQFILLEENGMSIYINEYPAIYSENVIPLFSNVICGDKNQTNYFCGYIIGSHKKYYPIVPFKSPLMCGYHNILQFNNSKPVYFRDFWWKNINNLYKSFENSKEPIIQSYLHSTEICFVYVGVM